MKKSCVISSALALMSAPIVPRGKGHFMSLSKGWKQYIELGPS